MIAAGSDGISRKAALAVTLLAVAMLSIAGARFTHLDAQPHSHVSVGDISAAKTPPHSHVGQDNGETDGNASILHCGSNMLALSEATYSRFCPGKMRHEAPRAVRFNEHKNAFEPPPPQQNS